MRKQIGTFWLILLSLWYVPAMAEKYELYILNEQVTDENCKDLSKINNALIKLAPDGRFSYDPAKNILTMKGVDLNGPQKDVLKNNIEGLTIDISAENTMESDQSLLTFNANTTIRSKDKGKLSLLCPLGCVNIGANTTLTLTDVVMEAKSSNGVQGRVILGQNGESGENLVVQGSTVTLQGELAAIQNLEKFKLEKCSILEPSDAEFSPSDHAVVESRTTNVVKELKIGIAEYPLTIAGVKVTDLNKDNMRGIAPGVVKVSEDGIFRFAPMANNLLIMKGVEIAYDKGDAIVFDANGDFGVFVGGKNKITASAGSAFSAKKSNTIIEGFGELSLEGGKEASGLVCSKLKIESVTLDVKGKKGIEGTDALMSELKVQGAIIHATATEYAIGAWKTITLAEKFNTITLPASGKFDAAKYGIVESDGNLATEVKIECLVYLLAIAGEVVTQKDCADLSKIEKLPSGVVTLAQGGEFKYDPATKTLTMKDVTIQAPDGKPALNCAIGGVTINISGTNTLKAKKEDVFFIEGDATIEGKGTLSTISESESPSHDTKSGIKLGDLVTLTLSNTTLNTEGNFGIEGNGNEENTTLVIHNANLHSKGKEAAIVGLSTFKNDCQIVEPENGIFDKAKQGIVRKDGNLAKEVKIIPIAVTEIILDPTSLNFVEGDKAKKITAKLEPANASNKTVKWTSDNASVAKVDEDGNVTPGVVGTATITAAIEDGKKSKTCNVVVSKKTSVEDVVFANIVVTPNPFVDVLRISGLAKEHLFYALLTTQGVEVCAGTLQAGETQINTSELPSGIYLLQIRTAMGSTKTYRVVK